MAKSYFWISVSVIYLLSLAGCDSSSSPVNSTDLSNIENKDEVIFIEQASSAEIAVDAKGIIYLTSRYDQSIKAFDTQQKKWLWSKAVHGKASSITFHNNKLAATLPEEGKLITFKNTGEKLSELSGLQHPLAVIPHEQGWWVTDQHAQALLLIQNNQIQQQWPLPFQPGAMLLHQQTLWLAGRNSADFYSMDINSDSAPAPSTELTLLSNTQLVDSLAWLNNKPVALVQQANLGNNHNAVKSDTGIRPALLQPNKSALFLDLSGNIISRPIALSENKTLQEIWIAGANSHNLQRYETGINNWLFKKQINLTSPVRGIWFDDINQQLWVWLPLEFKLLLLDAEGQMLDSYIVEPRHEVDSLWLLGAKLFQTANDKRLSQGWMACDSCHPDNGLDHKTWRMDEGWRNTPNIGGALDTLPMHWRGDRGRLDVIELNFRNLMGGQGVVSKDIAATDIQIGDSEELDAIAHFMESLAFIAGQQFPTADSQQVNQGKKLFQQLGCDTCHSGSHYTNQSLEDIGTHSLGIDTPTLKGIAYSAPYLHDGRAKSLKSIFTEHNPEQKHGQTAGLNEEELTALLEYLKTL